MYVCVRATAVIQRACLGKKEKKTLFLRLPVFFFLIFMVPQCIYNSYNIYVVLYFKKNFQKCDLLFFAKCQKGAAHIKQKKNIYIMHLLLIIF